MASSPPFRTYELYGISTNVLYYVLVREPQW